MDTTAYKTYIQKPSEVEKKWYLIDAKNHILGRLATKTARVLIGKGKVTYTPHVDGGDHVVIINAMHIRVTGKKRTEKMYSHFSGYPSGRREYNFETLMARKPEEIIIRAVERMLPKNRLGQKMIKHLHVYAGETHQHQAQKPIPLSR